MCVFEKMREIKTTECVCVREREREGEIACGQSREREENRIISRIKVNTFSQTFIFAIGIPN